MNKPNQRRFSYQKRDPDTVRQRANMRGGDFDSMFKDGAKLFKPREGKNIIRILPPTWPDANHYGYEIWCNYGIGIDEQSYLSLSKMKSEPDPLADARKQAEREGNKKLADELAPKRRVLIYVIDRNAEEEGPQLWSAPWTVDKDFCNIAYDEDTREVIMVDDPEEGCDIRFYKEGTGRNTKYDAAKMKIMKPTPLHEDEVIMNEWLDFVQSSPLPDVLNYYDFDHIASVFDGHLVKGNPPKVEDEGLAPKPKVPRVAVEDHDEDGVVQPRPRPKVVAKEEPPFDLDDETPNTVAGIRDRLRAKRVPASRPVDDDE